MSTRPHLHTSATAPALYANASISQSKSHVLAGVQDAYWSDDEAEDAECPLCLEEMDISDLNFKPCICGYQICQFCWHHIKENLNGRCPACRRVYTDEMVEFKPIPKDDHKRLTQQKKQRERERKELDALGRRQLVNVRVVQRNVVYVVGIGPRFAKEELIPTLRSAEYFGQYGKIPKILLVKRTPPGGGAPVVGLYITYLRREDAARAIAAVDGTSSPGGGREVMRASYGTTKYCMSFLRSQSCGDHNCKNLHEWGNEKDCFTKEDLTTLKHTMKATESRNVGKKGEEAEGLPRTAAWGHKPAQSTSGSQQTTNTTNHVPVPSTARQQVRRGGGTRQSRTVPLIGSDSRSAGRSQDRKGVGTTKTSSQGSSSRPSTPASISQAQISASPPEPKPLRQIESHMRPRSPASSVAVESDLGSGPRDSSPSSPAYIPQSAQSLAPPGIFAVPAAPAVPPGISGPSRPPRVDAASPATPLLAAQTSYQMSNAARALLDEVKGRRETLAPSLASSPFPDLDRTLQTLSGGNDEFGGFSFNLDPKLIGEGVDDSEPLPTFDIETIPPYRGTFMEVFPTLRPANQGLSGSYVPPPSLPYFHNPTRSIYDPASVRCSPIERQSTGGSSYTGSFNPFADTKEDSGSSSIRAQPSSLDDDSGRKMSRFGFARRQGSTAASSPAHVSSPLSNSNSESHTSFFGSMEMPSPAITYGLPVARNLSEYTFAQSGIAPMPSPLVHHATAPATFSQQQSRFQSFDSGISEAQLRDLIQSSRQRGSSLPMSGPSDSEVGPHTFMPTQQLQFSDPAIMSARFAPPGMPTMYDFAFGNPPPAEGAQLAYGPPPGLAFPQPNVSNAHLPAEQPQSNGSSHAAPPIAPPSPPLALSSSDFPALIATSSQTPTVGEDASTVSLNDKAQRKAAKKAVAAERISERLRAAQEKTAEKARLAAEKEKAQQEKALREKAEKQNAERDRLAREKATMAEKERVAQLEREKATQVERERVAQLEKEKAAQVKRTSANRQPVKTVDPPAPKQTSVTPTAPEPSVQVPLLSKKPKKNKPSIKPIRVAKEDEAAPSEAPAVPAVPISDPELEAFLSSVPAPTTVNSTSTNSRAQSVDRSMPPGPKSLKQLFNEIELQNPAMNLSSHPFFDLLKINPAEKMPLEYGPLVHALSALSVGGGSFANNMPTGTIDNAVSSFQQLLETLTQTISDLLRLLPRTTWDDSSSFDGVLRDMLKGDDFLDDGEDGHAKDDEVAALTLALERRARWMEVQLSKLEELHRDINTAAVRAILSFNDNGWDRHALLPRVGSTLRRFDNIGMINDAQKGLRAMTADELEKKLAVAKEAAVFAELEVKEMMEKMQAYRPVVVEV